jgi:hypothetical protein
MWAAAHILFREPFTLQAGLTADLEPERELAHYLRLLFFAPVMRVFGV